MEQPTQQPSATTPPAQGAATPPAPAAPIAVSVPHRGKAVAGMVLGIIGIFAWFLPFIGYPVTIVGIILSTIGLKSDKKGMAITGLVLSIIFLIATIINSVIGAMIAVNILNSL